MDRKKLTVLGLAILATAGLAWSAHGPERGLVDGSTMASAARELTNPWEPVTVEPPPRINAHDLTAEAKRRWGKYSPCLTNLSAVRADDRE